MKAKGAGNHREANALVEFRPQGEIRASPLHGGLWGLAGPGRRVCEKFCKGHHWRCLAADVRRLQLARCLDGCCYAGGVRLPCHTV